MSLLRITAGIISQPASGSPRDYLGPRALCSERVIVSRSSPPLWPDPPVSPAPPDFTSRLIQEAVPDNLVWAANDTFPALGQCSFHTCRHLYAGRRIRALSPRCDPAPWPSPPNQLVGTSNVPGSG